MNTALWRDSWETVMGGFVPGLAELERTVHVAAEAAAGGPPRRVLDLGGGPGVLAERMARRWPAAAVTLLDIDPVLLAMARAGVPSNVTVVEADLTSDPWPSPGGYDLITAVMTVHYLTPEQAAGAYATAWRALAPGGVLVVADLMPDDGLPGLMGALEPGPDEAAAELAWAQWWANLEGLEALLHQRAATFRDKSPAEFVASAGWHAAAARRAGFAEAGVVWRCGRHAALAAVRT
ncbi:class I SAM-dependent methyltransferase [Actinoplanes sp. RD1]|uniref:class I SAM-dependent methyltransferase n=1 Tax=Actinoplanes sp. RD1 TaxID=3064538 RepID=UPI0027410319|nr:class I SAM-dependent methyltransferase [Actinoplanes sp. RD1]